MDRYRPAQTGTDRRGPAQTGADRHRPARTGADQRRPVQTVADLRRSAQTGYFQYHRLKMFRIRIMSGNFGRQPVFWSLTWSDEERDRIKRDPVNRIKV